MHASGAPPPPPPPPPPSPLASSCSSSFFSSSSSSSSSSSFLFLLFFLFFPFFLFFLFLFLFLLFFLFLVQRKIWRAPRAPRGSLSAHCCNSITPCHGVFHGIFVAYSIMAYTQIATGLQRAMQTNGGNRLNMNSLTCTPNYMRTVPPCSSNFLHVPPCSSLFLLLRKPERRDSPRSRHGIVKTL